MRIWPGFIRMTAALSWGVTVITAFTGFDGDPDFSPLDERLWFCALGISLLSTLAALQNRIAGKAARLYVAATKAAVTRPPGGGPPSGPLMKLVTGPMKILPHPGRQHGQHAARPGR